MDLNGNMADLFYLILEMVLVALLQDWLSFFYTYGCRYVLFSNGHTKYPNVSSDASEFAMMLYPELRM